MKNCSGKAQSIRFLWEFYLCIMVPTRIYMKNCSDEIIESIKFQWELYSEYCESVFRREFHMKSCNGEVE